MSGLDVSNPGGKVVLTAHISKELLCDGSYTNPEILDALHRLYKCMAGLLGIDIDDILSVDYLASGEIDVHYKCERLTKTIRAHTLHEALGHEKPTQT